MFLGMTLADWIGLLHENHFGVERHYWLRAASISLNSLSNSAFRQIEDAAFLPQIQDVHPAAPLFILGHARSGTTYLHNLLAMDQRFAYPNVYQVYYPHTFLCTEAIFARLLTPFLPKKRPQDNVALTINMPAEDEVATCIATCQSPYMRYIFPHRGDYFDRYYTFRTVADHEKSRWKNALLLFLKKLAWKYERPLLLKSPPHTARIRLLLEMFPNARFVHIHRNPYRVFQSTKHLDPMAFRSFTLQPPEHDVDQRILHNYKRMYDVYFADRTRIPRGQFHEICFEDLEADPVGQLRETYQALGLPSFENFRPRLEPYVSSLGDYRKNEFPDVSPRLRARIYRAWHRCFEEWGYPQ
jgi:omega-hydroxy-beta-dihydromenaquinone-9 sulfotransferase